MGSVGCGTPCPPSSTPTLAGKVPRGTASAAAPYGDEKAARQVTAHSLGRAHTPAAGTARERMRHSGPQTTVFLECGDLPPLCLFLLFPCRCDAKGEKAKSADESPHSQNPGPAISSPPPQARTTNPQATLRAVTPTTRSWPDRASPGNGRRCGAGTSFSSGMARSTATRGSPGSAWCGAGGRGPRRGPWRYFSVCQGPCVAPPCILLAGPGRREAYRSSWTVLPLASSRATIILRGRPFPAIVEAPSGRALPRPEGAGRARCLNRGAGVPAVLSEGFAATTPGARRARSLSVLRRITELISSRNRARISTRPQGKGTGCPNRILGATWTGPSTWV
jgi:hypothetical protein